VVFIGQAVGTVTPKDGSIVSSMLADANLEMPNTLDLNGKEFFLDADADTSITADTDDRVDIKIAGTDKIHITSTGLGIGTTSPSADLGVNGRVTLGDQAGSGTAGAGSMIVGANSFFIQASEHKDSSTRVPIVFSNIGGSTESMRIDASGNVGIGESSPSLGSQANGMHITGASGNDGVLKLDSSDTSHSGKLQFTENGTDQWRIAYDPTNNHLEFTESGVADRLVLADGGNVGIGTTSPDADLTLPSPSYGSGGAGNGIRFQNTNNDADAIIQTYYSGTTASALLHGQNVYLATNASFTNFDSSKGSSYILQNTDGQILFANASSSAPSERMRINSDGFVLLHTTSDGGVGNTFKDTGQQRMAMSGTSAFQIVQFANGNGQIGTIVLSGSSTSFNTSSDYRLKENVVTEWDATTRLKQLKPSRFNFKTDKDTTLDGFLAHEVSDIVPEAISGEKDAVDKDGKIEPQAIDQSKLVPLMVKTIQELEARIAKLEAK
jgi:hypothetical protein